MKTKKQDDGCKSAEMLKVDKKKSKITGEKTEGPSKAKTNTRVRTIKEMFLNTEKISQNNENLEKKINCDVTECIKSEKIEKKKKSETKTASPKTSSPKSSSTETKNTKENKKPKKEGPAKSTSRAAKTISKNADKKKVVEKNTKAPEPVEVEEEIVEMEIPGEVIEVGAGCALGSIMKLNFKADVSPSARWGHSLTMVNESEAILVGGQGDKQQLCKDACLMLSISRHRWHAPETTVEQGQKPEARMGHTAVFDPAVRCLYLFGGSKNKRWFNDVHVLNVDEMKWHIVKTNGKAPTRAYHTSTLYRNELWVFGGVFPQPDPQPDGCSNDIHVYSPVEESWYMPIVMGDKPEPRSGHSATLLQDRVVFFGGWDYPTVCGNDAYILDLTLVEWSQPKVNGTPPAPRSWHSSCALYGNRVLIHGGYDGDIALQDSFIFNLDTLTWTSIVIPKNILARCGHTACCLPYKHDKEGHDDVIIFGGGDNDGAFFDDLLCLRVPIDK